MSELALYHVVGMQPRLDMSGFGFCIKIYKEMRDAVRESGLKQQHIERWIDTMHPELLRAHGYPTDGIARHYLRITWGEWGPEHITVPGNACGLDIDRGLYAPSGGRVLLPHNVDCMKQSHLMLCIFTGLMDILMGNQEAKARGEVIKPFEEVGCDAMTADQLRSECRAILRLAEAE